jgi:hypothetical protein
MTRFPIEFYVSYKSRESLVLRNNVVAAAAAGCTHKLQIWRRI